MEQPQYNLLDRERFEVEYDPIFKQYGMGTTTWSPLASGALTGKYLEGIPEGSRASLEGYEWLKKGMIDSDRGQDRMRRVATYIKIAEQYSLSPSQLAIAWCLLNQNVSTVILGASSIEQLQNNLGSLNCMEALNNEDLTKSLSTIGL
jgi:aryl-alcohol dehydrogenase-like predicted oxidoreductase